VRCPTCGADVDADDYWCERCATRLDTDRRPVPQPVQTKKALRKRSKPPAPPYVPKAPPAASPLPVVRPPTSADPAPRFGRVRSPAVPVVATIATAMLVVVFALGLMRVATDGGTDVVDAPEPPAAEQPVDAGEKPEAPEATKAPAEAVQSFSTAGIRVDVRGTRQPPTVEEISFTEDITLPGNVTRYTTQSDESYRITKIDSMGVAEPAGVEAGFCQLLRPDSTVERRPVRGGAAWICGTDAGAPLAIVTAAVDIVLLEVEDDDNVNTRFERMVSSIRLSNADG
jgi:hypothetical protein